MPFGDSRARRCGGLGMSAVVAVLLVACGCSKGDPALSSKEAVINETRVDPTAVVVRTGSDVPSGERRVYRAPAGKDLKSLVQFPTSFSSYTPQNPSTTPLADGTLTIATYVGKSPSGGADCDITMGAVPNPAKFKSTPADFDPAREQLFVLDYSC